MSVDRERLEVLRGGILRAQQSDYEMMAQEERERLAQEYERWMLDINAVFDKALAHDELEGRVKKAEHRMQQLEMIMLYLSPGAPRG